MSRDKENENRKPVESITRDEAEKIVGERFARVFVKVKWFALGLGALVIFFVVTDLIGKAALLRMLHEEVFPSAPSGQAALAFQDTFELKASDDHSAFGSVFFYAEKGQPVKLYAQLNHRFTGSGPRRRVVVSIDGKQIGKPTLEFIGGFKNITLDLDWKTDPEKPDNFHSIVFSLDDSQDDTIKDQVIVTCIVMVYGQVKQ